MLTNATSRPFKKMVTTLEMGSWQIRMDLIAAVANVLRPLKSLNCREQLRVRPRCQSMDMQLFDTSPSFVRSRLRALHALGDYCAH